MNVINSIKNAVDDRTNALWYNMKHDIADFFINLSEQIRHGISHLMEDLINLILTTPNVSEEPTIHAIWEIIRTISFAIIGGLFVWEGLKTVLSQGSIGRTVQFKDMFVRMIYGIILAVFSLNLVDIMINLNNSLVEVIKLNFPMTIDSKIYHDNTFSYLMSIALLIVQIVLCVRIAIQYFMRMGEIWLMAVLSPIFYTLWISPNMGGYLGTWIRRIFSTIMTQFVWAVILAIYTGLVGLVALQGSIWSMCMSLALLLIMLKTPSYLHQFMQSSENPFQILNSAKNRTMRNLNKVTSFKNGITKKATGFIKGGK